PASGRGTGRVGGVARGDDHVVTGSDQGCGKGGADIAGSDDGDLHGCDPPCRAMCRPVWPWGTSSVFVDSATICHRVDSCQYLVVENKHHDRRHTATGRGRPGPTLAARTRLDPGRLGGRERREHRLSVADRERQGLALALDV